MDGVINAFQYYLGFPEDVMAMDMTNACIGFSNGLLMLANLIQSGIMKAGILISGEHLGPITDTTMELLDPDSDIAPANRTFRAVLKDGSVVTGRVLNLDQFTVQLFDSKERLLTLQRADLREFGNMKSPMPSYRDKLTAQELSDLVAYLASLKSEVK